MGDTGLDIFKAHALIPESVLTLATASNHSLEWVEVIDGAISAEIDLTSFLIAEVIELLPCFSLSSKQPYGFTFSFHLTPIEGTIEVFNLAPIGELGLLENHRDKETSSAKSEIDILVLKAKPERLLLKIHVYGVALEMLNASPWILSLAQKTRRTEKANISLPLIASEMSLNIPPLSQMEVAEIGNKICSPTCVAMALSFLTREAASPETIATLTHSKAHAIYGIWPAALYAASRFGVVGLLAYFTNWEQVKMLLDSGIPLIVSIRYAKGEIAGVALERDSSVPSGHLILISGYKKELVEVFDPAAPTRAEVKRSYRYSDLTEVWLNRAAVGYVLFPAPPSTQQGF